MNNIMKLGAKPDHVGQRLKDIQVKSSQELFIYKEMKITQDIEKEIRKIHTCTG